MRDFNNPRLLREREREGGGGGRLVESETAA